MTRKTNTSKGFGKILFLLLSFTALTLFINFHADLAQGSGGHHGGGGRGHHGMAAPGLVLPGAEMLHGAHAPSSLGGDCSQGNAAHSAHNAGGAGGHHGMHTSGSTASPGYITYNPILNSWYTVTSSTNMVPNNTPLANAMNPQGTPGYIPGLGFESTFNPFWYYPNSVVDPSSQIASPLVL